MKRITLILLTLATSLAACAAPTPVATSVPLENNLPVPGASVTEIVVEPQGKIRAPSFESQTYVNEAAGFALDYPAGWTVKEDTVGSRGSETLLLSTPEIAGLETIPAGQTRVALTVYQWDPKNDLAAFVATRKTAWESSSFTILDEEPLTLDLGLSAVRFTVQSPDGVTSLFMFAAIGDQYLSLSGEGDRALVQEITQYLRPISK